MIQILDNRTVATNPSLLASMFADRKRLFVDLLGWDLPVIDGRYENDRFDNADAVYLVAVESGGTHAASLRMLPTIRPNMLGAIFPHLCPLGVPTGETIWETTRLCLPQRHGANRRRELRNLLFSAAIDFSLARGIERLTGIVPNRFRTELLALGWQAEPLGPAVQMAGGAVGAFMVHVGADTPERLGWTGTYIASGRGEAL